MRVEVTSSPPVPVTVFVGGEKFEGSTPLTSDVVTEVGCRWLGLSGRECTIFGSVLVNEGAPSPNTLTLCLEDAGERACSTSHGGNLVFVTLEIEI